MKRPTFHDGPQKRAVYYQRMSDTATIEYACTAGLWLEELERFRVAGLGRRKAARCGRVVGREQCVTRSIRMRLD